MSEYLLAILCVAVMPLVAMLPVTVYAYGSKNIRSERSVGAWLLVSLSVILSVTGVAALHAYAASAYPSWWFDNGWLANVDTGIGLVAAIVAVAVALVLAMK